MAETGAALSIILKRLFSAAYRKYGQGSGNDLVYLHLVLVKLIILIRKVNTDHPTVTQFVLKQSFHEAYPKKDYPNDQLPNMKYPNFALSNLVIRN
ncbi:unnamed protein product [Auanema sp. JU1783]|nr:unnamed protein product [Auanema sp. JU1783]